LFTILKTTIKHKLQEISRNGLLCLNEPHGETSLQVVFNFGQVFFGVWGVMSQKSKCACVCVCERAHASRIWETYYTSYRSLLRTVHVTNLRASLLCGHTSVAEHKNYHQL